MRILRFGVLALGITVLFEGLAASPVMAQAPFPLFAPVYAQSRAYRKAVRYSARHPFAIGSPVAIPVQPVAAIPVKNVATGYYSPTGYFYRASYRSPVLTGAAANEPVVLRPAAPVAPVEAVPVEPEVIPAPNPMRLPMLP